MPLLFFLFTCFAVACSHAEAPLDINSPFPKIALIKDNSGKVVEREIQSVKLVEEMLELNYPNGGVGLFPKESVVAILPRLPVNESQASPEDVDRIIHFLENLPEKFRIRLEASPETLQRWKALKVAAEKTLDSKKQTNAQTQERQIHEDTVRILKLVAEKDFKNAVIEGEAFLRNHPDLPARKDVILVLARSYRSLGKNKEAVKYYKITKEALLSQEPDPEYANGIKEADEFIEAVENKQGNTTSCTSLNCTIEDLINKYGDPVSSTNRITRDKSVVEVGLSEIMRRPEFVFDNVYVFKKILTPSTGGHILITCGTINGKTAFIKYENNNNPFYPGKMSFFSKSDLYLLMSNNSNNAKFKSITISDEDRSFEYYKEPGSGTIVVTLEGRDGDSHFATFFTTEGWQAYYNYQMEYNSSGLKGL